MSKSFAAAILGTSVRWCVETARNRTKPRRFSSRAASRIFGGTGLFHMPSSRTSAYTQLRWRSNVLQAPMLGLVTAVCGLTALAVSPVDKKGRVQHWIARIWARMRGVGFAVAVEGGGKGEPAQAPGRGVCPEPHILHGHSGDFCGAAVSVPHPGEERICGSGRSSAGISSVPDRCRLISRTRMRRSQAWAAR